jgi:hypothetical protein
VAPGLVLATQEPCNVTGQITHNDNLGGVA